MRGNAHETPLWQIVFHVVTEARRLFTSLQQAFVNLRRGTPGRLPPPIEDIGTYASATEMPMIDQALSCSIIGSAQSVMPGIRDFVARTQVDELMITANIYEHAARLKSFAMIAEMQNLIGHRHV